MPSEGRGNFLNTVIPPQTAHTTEGRNTAFGAHPCSRENEDAVGGGNGTQSRHELFCTALCSQTNEPTNASKVAFSHGRNRCVKTQLTAHPITGKVPTRGVIKVISYYSTDNVLLLAPGLRGWATHIQAASKTAYAVTETKFAEANLTGTEEGLLQNLCYYDALLSGQPCTCTPEDHDF